MMIEIDKRYTSSKKELIASFCALSDISVTVDIWTDRKMRAFLGVTAHYLSPNDHQLKSALLCCERMSGKN